MAAQEFFTVDSLLQSGGAVVIVTTVSVAVRRLTRWTSPWIALISALAVSYLGAGISGALDIGELGKFPTKQFFQGIGAWALPLANATLLFLAALGGTDTVGAITTPAPPAGNRPNAKLRYADRPVPKLFESWFGNK